MLTHTDLPLQSPFEGGMNSPPQKWCLGGPSQARAPSLQASLGKTVSARPIPWSLLAVGVPQLRENGVALGEASEKRDPKGWNLGFGFIYWVFCGGVCEDYYLFIWSISVTLVENESGSWRLFSPFWKWVVKVKGLAVLSWVGGKIKQNNQYALHQCLASFQLTFCFVVSQTPAQNSMFCSPPFTQRPKGSEPIFSQALRVGACCHGGETLLSGAIAHCWACCI